MLDALTGFAPPHNCDSPSNNPSLPTTRRTPTWQYVFVVRNEDPNTVEFIERYLEPDDYCWTRVRGRCRYQTVTVPEAATERELARELHMERAGEIARVILKIVSAVKVSHE
jgi:hypothetical protein